MTSGNIPGGSQRNMGKPYASTIMTSPSENAFALCSLCIALGRIEGWRGKEAKRGGYTWGGGFIHESWIS